MKFGLDKLKKINKSYLLAAALTGILLLVLTIPTEEKKEVSQQEGGAAVSSGNNTGTESSRDLYRKSLERQLEQTLAAVEGVGKVKVMITLKDTGESIVEKDRTRTEETTEEADGQGLSRKNSAVSSQEASVYIRGGSQEESPFVTKEINPKVEGVLVVAEGGENSIVIKNISEAILALFPIEAHKIKVVKMN